jgi:hypothetical protein
MSFAVLSHFQTHAGFDPLKDFKMIGQTTRSTLVLVVPADSKMGDLASFIANASKSGHDVSLATAGPGSTPHLAALSFSKAAKIDPLMVPYRGMTPAVTDLLGGRVTGAFVGPQSAVGLVKEKKLKMLAAIGQQRLEKWQRTFRHSPRKASTFRASGRAPGTDSPRRQGRRTPSSTSSMPRSIAHSASPRFNKGSGRSASSWRRRLLLHFSRSSTIRC